MKKTLQIMMVAASALLGAVSCGGGGGNGTNANAAVQPISPSDFAQGKMGYTIWVNGESCLLRVQGGSSTDTTATVTSGIFRLDDDEGGEYACKMTYQLNESIAASPTQAVISIEFGSSDAMKEDAIFKKFWGIPEGSEIKDGATYTLTLSFRDATVIAKSPAGETVGRFKAELFTSPGGADIDAPGA